jgi:hypothetical protein
MEGSDLEENSNHATLNIEEMLKVSLPANVNVVLATGAANKAEAGAPVDNWREHRYYSIRNKMLKLEKNLNVTNMGTPGVLTDFIKWGQAQFPADRYMLVFWDHGGGALGGYGGNLVYDNAEKTIKNASFADNLTVEQLKGAVNDAVENDPGRKFEIIGFDACLMATLEVADAFKEVGSYLVASQDIEPGQGWDWQVFLQFVSDNSSATGGSIGKAIADAYADKMKNAGESAITLSVIDLSKIDAINSALAAFSEGQKSLLNAVDFSSRLIAWFDLASARATALDFYTSSLSSGDAKETVDLIDFARQSQFDPINDPKTKALLRAAENAVYYKVWGEKRSKASGINIMFPGVTVWDADQITKYSNLSFVKAYRDLVFDFSAFARDSNFPAFTIAAPSAAGNTFTADVTVSGGAPVKYERAYIAQTWTSAENVIYFDGLQPLFPVSPALYMDPLSYTWTGSWYYLGTTDADAKPVAMIADRESRTMSDGSVKEFIVYKIPLYLKIKKYNQDISATYFIEDDLSKNDGDAGKFTHIGYQAQNTLLNQAYPFSQLAEGDIVYPKSLSISADTPLGTWQYYNYASFTVGSNGQTGVQLFKKTGIAKATTNLRFVLYDLRWKPVYSDLF